MRMWLFWIRNGLGRGVWEGALSLMHSMRTELLWAMGWPSGKASMRNISYAQEHKRCHMLNDFTTRRHHY